MIQVVDLFSCVGAHSLGLHRASSQFETVLFCESRPFRRRVLEARFPGVPVYTDVRYLHPSVILKRGSNDLLGIVDSSQPVLVAGGPPCQNTSTISSISGSRSGESLVGEQIRVGIGLDAEWIVVEQPPGHALWEIRTAESLARAGYHVGRVEFGASDLGAPYIRRRVFILACAQLRGLEVAVDGVPDAIAHVRGQSATGPDTGRPWSTDLLRTLRVAREFTPRLDESGRASRDPDGGLRRDRIEAIGDSNPPEMMEVIGRAIAASYLSSASA